MGNPVIRTARALHAWAGAILSVLMIILSITGALLVWKDDYLRLTMPEARQAFDASPENLGALSQAAEAEFGAENIRLIVFGHEGMGLNKVYLHGDRFAYLTPNGEVVAIWSGNGRFEEWLFELHHYLLAGETGMVIAGIAGLAMAVLIIAGLIAFWPTRKAFRLGVSLRSLRRPHLLLSHRNLGIVAALPAFLILITGAGVVFHDETKALLSALNGETEPTRTITAEATKTTGTVDRWTRFYATGAEAFPEGAIRMGIWPSAERPASLRVRQAGEWHPNGRSTLAALPPSSAVVATDAQQFGLGDRVYNSFYPLHAAKTGGILYKLVVFFTGLALTALGLLGLISFVQRLLGMRPAPVIRRSTQTVTPPESA